MESVSPTPPMGESIRYVQYRGSIRRSLLGDVLRLGDRSNRLVLRTPALRIPRHPPSGRHPIRQDTWQTVAAPSCRGDRGRPLRPRRGDGQAHHLANSPCVPGVAEKARLLRHVSRSPASRIWWTPRQSLILSNHSSGPARGYLMTRMQTISFNANPLAANQESWTPAGSSR